MRSAIMGLVLLVCGVTEAGAAVFHSKEAALRLAFPEGEAIETRTLFLKPDETREIEALARSRLESKLVTVYVGRRAGRVLGYAFIETHVVRTMPETVLVVLAPGGRVMAVHVLAFHEPLEYLPSARWLGQFAGRRLDPDLWVGRGIHGISGATLSARAIAEAVRRVLAIHQVLLREERR